MIRKITSYLFRSILIISIPLQAVADDSARQQSSGNGCPGPVPILESDKPIFFGVTKDSGDNHSYFDMSISLDIPIAYESRTTDDNGNCDLSGKWLTYFGINLASAYYAVPGDLRKSRPVIGKVFNPFFRYRYFTDTYTIKSKDDFFVTYIDGEYGHLSNGQSMSTLNEFNATSTTSGSSRYAQDYISRGWDYVGTSAHWFIGQDYDDKHYNAVTVNLRKYIGGIFQRSIEEYNTRIEPQRMIQGLNQVSGIRGTWIHGIENNKFISSYALTFDTGIDQPLKRISTRIDTDIFHHFFHAKQNSISLDLWARSGYAANLAHYYQRIDSVGIALLFETFKSTNTPSHPMLQCQ